MPSGSFWGGFAKTGPSKLLSDYYMSGERELAEDYAKGTGVTEKESAEQVAAYQETAAGLRNVDPDGNDQYAHLTPEQRTKAADTYDSAAKTGLGYHVGRGDGQQGTRYDAAPTESQIRMSGQEAQVRGLYSRGKAKEALAMEAQLDSLKTGEITRKAATQAIELGGIQLNSAKRQEELDGIIRAAGSADDTTFLTAMTDFATNKAGDKNEGFTYRRDAETGQIFIQQHDRKTRELLGEQPWDGDRGALITRLTKYHNAASFNAATTREAEEKQRGITNTREDKKVNILETAENRRAEADDRRHRESMAKMNAYISALGTKENLANYSLEQQKEFDKERKTLIADYDSGKITEEAMNKRLNVLQLKFGSGGGKPLGEPAIKYADWAKVNEPGVGESSEAHMRRYRKDIGTPAAAGGGMNTIQTELVKGKTQEELDEESRRYSNNMLNNGGRGIPSFRNAPKELPGVVAGGLYRGIFPNVTSNSGYYFPNIDKPKP